MSFLALIGACFVLGAAGYAGYTAFALFMKWAWSRK
jgi:hypothetical protein